MIDSYCGRTSLSQTMKALQLVAHPLIPREIKNDFPSQKPLLLLVTRSDLSGNEKMLIQKSIPVSADSLLSLYELPLDSLDPPVAPVSNFFREKKDSMFIVGSGLYASDSTGAVVMKFFPQGKPFESGHKVKGDTLLIFHGPVPADSLTELEASVWTFVDRHSHKSPQLVVRLYDGRQALKEEFAGDPITNPDIAYGWLRQKVVFRKKSPGDVVEIFIRGKRMEATRFLLRPVATDVYHQPDQTGSLWLNNFFIPEK
jgi:hypothetical protein